MTEAEASYRAALAVSRTVARAVADGANAGRRRTSVVLGGNGNVEFLKPGLEAVLWADGALPNVRVTGYDDWINAAFAGAENADAWVIWLSSLAWSRRGQQRPDAPIETIAGAIRAVRQSGATVIVVLPEPEPAEADPFSPFARWRLELTASLRAALAEHAVLIDPTVLLMSMPLAEWSDPRYWSAAKCPWSPDAATRLGALCGHTLARLSRPRIRAIAVDFDDTLWGGVVGELGAEGVMLDPLGEGAPFLALQRLLKDLSAAGVMLAAVSKNNPADALAVFERRAEMLLKRDDFLLFEVHWSSKAESIGRMAEQLNIGLDAICFLDNSPHERSEVRHLLPQVVVPELPESPDDWLAFLAAARLFLKPVVREDDILRVGAYRADAGRREQEAQAIDRASYLQGLNMRLTARRLERPAIPRATELIQKTNQFNLTNRRHSEKRVVEIAGADRVYAYSFEVADTFGESGTVAVVLALPDGDTLDIDTFVMSCRVVNRTVERAIFSHLLAWAESHGIAAVRGHYLPSERNGLVAGFFSSLGLELVSEAGAAPDEQVWEGRGLAAPSHYLAVDEKEPNGA